MTLQQEHRSVEERREQLVDAAIAVLRDGGISAVTTRAVTARAGLPHGAFHYCFASKAPLFRAVLERQLRTAMAVAFAPPVTRLDLEARIASGLSAHLAQTRTDPATALAVVELVTHSRRDPDLRDLAAWEQQAYLDAVRAQVEEWTADDGIRWAVPVEHVVRLLIATADGIGSTWLADRDDTAAQATVLVAARSIAALAAGSGA
ncbi:TetR/AcrR family transcriptional regulator [Curtobacterium sp. VKM Ac-1393]|uniref:TetR/AcrR family transcriptional regulator n=1 Tax=Curtobacterium sp. VKM Ac-1393 TaxID=2783814 RepID=UPI00188DA472|nr:TetR/AcrR family transcriptional regulator [Curtobacterium sp. VKM Ac-1393]MBF4608227.1 TetR/AcrR family transcriptional regulator [Curtobacterium sp. VKM Ac-1393]